MNSFLAFHSGDLHLAKELLVWIDQLGGVKKHKLVLVADAAVQWSYCVDCMNLAKKAFGTVQLITNDSHVAGWIPGSNSLWLTAAKHAERIGSFKRNSCWLFLEPDVVPLTPSWLDDIAAESLNRAEHDKFYIGSIIPSNRMDCEPLYFEGIGCYAGNAYSALKHLVSDEKSWTLTTTKEVMPWAENSDLFHHIWGEKDNPPKFAEKNIPGTSTFCLNQIPKEAVIFHRNKDGSLIKMLRKKYGIKEPFKNPMMLVFPFCNVDANAAIKNLKWIVELRSHYDFDIVLTYDTDTMRGHVNEMNRIACKAFRSVTMYQYPRPRQGDWAPSTAFRETARLMSKSGRPWLWHESDSVALKPEWLDVIQAEYVRGGKPFAGPVVDYHGHCNGTAVYPSNTPDLIPKALAQRHTAWDSAMKDEMIHLCHPINHVFWHFWGEVGGVLHESQGGPIVFSRGSHLLDQIPSGLVCIHRDKTLSLVDRIKDGSWKPK